MPRRGLFPPGGGTFTEFGFPSRHARHPRLFAGVAIGLVVNMLLPSSLHHTTRLLIDWNAGPGFISLHGPHDRPRVSAIDKAAGKNTRRGEIFYSRAYEPSGVRGDRGNCCAACRREGYVRDAEGPAYWTCWGDDRQRLVLHSSDLRPPLLRMNISTNASPNRADSQRRGFEISGNRRPRLL